MPLLTFLFLLLCYWLSGHGLLTLFRMRLKPAYTITLSFLLGIAVASFIPFLLQLFYIVINGPTVFGALLLTALLLNVPSFLRARRAKDPSARTNSASGPNSASSGPNPGFPRKKALVSRSTTPRASLASRFRVQPYEIPFWLILGFLIFVSVWRCYYLPPTSRDALSGPETIAEYTVREQTMINSFFKIDLWSTNNQFKSPFLISLQVIYKLAGFPFGQIWLSIVFICFTVFLYHALKERLHPIIAGLLLLLFMMAPEIYAYTFMILYDYSNMVFYCLGLYFLFRALAEKRLASGAAPALTEPAPNAAAIPTTPPKPSQPAIPALPAPATRRPATFQFAGLLLGISTYIRSETLILVVLTIPLILLVQWQESRRSGPFSLTAFKKIIVADLLFLLPSLLGYFLTTQLYIKYYLPLHYDIGNLVNDHLTDWHPLFQRYGDIVTRLLFGTFSIHLWGYLFYVAIALFLAELIFIRRFGRETRNWLYAIAVLYLALGFLGFVLPMFNLLETTKRALFKMMPLLLFYLANNEILLGLSRRISRWEALPRGGSVATAHQPGQEAKHGPVPAGKSGAGSAAGTRTASAAAGSATTASSKTTSKKKHRKK